jgi:type II secretion system protein L
VTRLFFSLPDPLPENLVNIVWRMPGAPVESGVADNATNLPAADERWLVLPASRVLLSSLTLSKRALRQLSGAANQSLGNALEDKLMLDPAQVHVALGKPLAGDVHPVAVIESAWLEQVLALCRQSGIEPFGAIPETLLWQGDAASGTWAARWRGHDGFVRSGPSAGFALDDGTREIPPLALQLALAEARRLDAMQQDAKPSAIVLETGVEVDVAAWSRSLGCPVLLQTLRADPQPPVLNLLQGPYASRRRGGGWLAGFAGSPEHLGKYRLAGGLLAATLAVHVLGTLADWARLSYENRQLRSEMRQVFQEVFPQTQAIVDPTLQMQRQLADLRRARGFAEPGDYLHAVSAVAGQVGGVSAMRYENGRLTLLQPRATDLDGLRSALAGLGYQMNSAGEAGNRSVSLERMTP